MDTESTLEDQLKKILDNIDKDSSLLALQFILTTSHNIAKIFSNPSTRDLILLILGQLKRSVLASNIYYMIQSCSASADHRALKDAKVKSLHDLEGRFLWVGFGCENIFGISEQNLKNCSLFGIMSQNSLLRLIDKHGKYLIKKNGSRIISYSLAKDQNTILTSKCTPAIIGSTPNSFEVGIILLTRHSKTKKIPSKSSKKVKILNKETESIIETPTILPEFSFLSPISSEFKFPEIEKISPPPTFFTPFQSKATPYKETEKVIKEIEPESISITPFLKTASPALRKKNKKLPQRKSVSAFK
ncbi:unnamed protein product [Blepharisma stoltei]|uniref:Uncharacterized protein n=1 Tax=Blepharisma stoltei TaxID=1481888 RepID=A0AAU9JYK2_9CILI|nr:unnamed protein product [Blepharisma stoltei]